MWQDIREVYLSGLRAAWVLPLLFLLPAAVEFAQHIVELRIGMYDGFAAAREVADDGSRMVWGYAKSLSLLPAGYWFVRWMAWSDARRARRIAVPAAPLWLVLFVLQGALQAFLLFGPSVGELLGLAGQAAQITTMLVTLVWSIVGIYFTAWMVAWPLGNAAIGPLRSVKVMAGSFWRTIGYMVAAILPLMIVHYALGYGAMTAPRWLAWPMLAVDALVVAWLATCMAGSSFVAARAAARRRNVPLFASEADTVQASAPIAA